MRVDGNPVQLALVARFLPCTLASFLFFPRLLPVSHPLIDEQVPARPLFSGPTHCPHAVSSAQPALPAHSHLHFLRMLTPVFNIPPLTIPTKPTRHSLLSPFSCHFVNHHQFSPSTPQHPATHSTARRTVVRVDHLIHFETIVILCHPPGPLPLSHQFGGLHNRRHSTGACSGHSTWIEEKRILGEAVTVDTTLSTDRDRPLTCPVHFDQTTLVAGTQTPRHPKPVTPHYTPCSLAGY